MAQLRILHWVLRIFGVVAVEAILHFFKIVVEFVIRAIPIGHIYNIVENRLVFPSQHPRDLQILADEFYQRANFFEVDFEGVILLQLVQDLGDGEGNIVTFLDQSLDLFQK